MNRSFELKTNENELCTFNVETKSAVSNRVNWLSWFTILSILGLLGASVDCHRRVRACRFRCINTTGEYRKGDIDDRAARKQLCAALLHDKDMANEVVVF